MRGVIAMLVLMLYLSGAWAEGESKGRIDQIDQNILFTTIDAVWDELRLMLNNTKTQVEKLEKKNADRRKVAFSVGLTDSGYVGPFQTEITLVYEKVFTNIDNGYDPNSGMFSAPVKGLYNFTFTSMGREPGQKMGVYLVKNGEQMIYNVQDNFHGGYEYITGAVALELEKDDLVYLRVPKGWGLYDDNYNHIVFTGILLFTTNPPMGYSNSPSPSSYSLQ
ncbi:unnamed protein product [Coregonus sp. 'balchen']|nr:unnamed protein product [Coregonus sp. 'balchen']